MTISGPEDFRSPPSGEPPASGRNRDGTFAVANTFSLTHGGRSAQIRAAQLPEQAGLRAELAAKRASLLTDLGGEDTLSQLQIDLVARYLELDVVATWLGGNLLAEGPLTAKGRSRAALSAYLTVLDRVQRVSSALGLARRPRAVSLNQYLTDTYEDAGSSRS